MPIDKIDEKLGVVAMKLIERTKGECPTDEEFALYMEGRLSKESRNAIISHFVSCSDCRERLTITTTPLEITESEKPIRGLLTLLWRPLVTVPLAALFLILAAVTLNVYIESRGTKEDVYRDGNLVALKQMDLTPNLLNVIRDGKEEKLKTLLTNHLPPGSQISRIVVQKELENLDQAKGSETVILILYSDGLLKLKLND